MKNEIVTRCKEQFREIYLNNQRDKIIPFLQQLSSDEKKALIPTLKKLIYEWNSDAETILHVALIACCNHTEIKKVQRNIFLKESDPLIRKLLDWYCPEWFSDFINERYEEDHTCPDYRIMLDWYHKGYLQPVGSMIAANLHSAIHHRTIHIEADPITLQEHIWTFFEHQNNYIFLENHTDKDGKKIQPCIKIIKQYSNNGTIDRMRLLKAILQTANYSFNKETVAWFCDLLETLAPTPAEFLLLQEELLNGLQTDRPRWTRMILAEVVRLLPEKTFNMEKFLSYLPVLLTKKEKNLLTMALQVVEKIGKAYPAQQAILCNELAPVFLTQDEKLQTKAAKLIVRYGSTAQQEIGSTLEGYRTYILHAAQEILHCYLPKEIPAVTLLPEKKKAAEYLPAISDANRLPGVNTWEDLVYFATQAYADKEAYFPVMLPDYIYRFNKELTPDRAKQLEAVYKLENMNGYSNDWTEEAWADGMLRMFMISYGRYLNNRFPGVLPAVATQQERKDLSDGRDYIGQGDYFTYPLYDRMAEIMQRIERQEYYEPVSMPTHYPLWINPVVLAERLQRCQQNNYRPISTELQQALMRCCLEDTGEACRKAESLEGEWKDLLLYLFGQTPLRKEQIRTPELWVTAALVRNGGILPELLLDEAYQVPAQLHPGYLHWEIDPQPYPDTKGKGIVFNPQVRFYQKEEPFFPLLYSYYTSYRLKSRYSLQSLDIYRLMISMPYSHEWFLSCVIEYISVESIIYTAQERWIRQVLKALRELRQPCKPMDHLAIAMSFFNKFKEVVQYAAETWYEGTEAGWIDSVELGKAMGRLIELEWQPLQRFTTILKNEMLLNRSHSVPLLQLIESILATIQKPVRGDKALREAHKELQSRTGQKL